MTHPTHKTRFSDSSLYDEKCELCGGTDGIGDDSLNQPCSKAAPDQLKLFEQAKAQIVIDQIVSRCRELGNPPEMTHKANLFDVRMFDFGSLGHNVAGHIVEGWHSKGGLRDAFRTALEVINDVMPKIGSADVLLYMKRLSENPPPAPGEEPTILKLKKILEEHLGMDTSQVTAGSMIQNFDKDSLDDLELIMAIEEEFGLEISDEDAEKMREMTLGEVSAWIDGRKK